MLLTRPPGRNEATAALLAGAEVVELPLIALESTGAALPAPSPGDLLVLTSARAVAELSRRLEPAALSGCRVAAVGPATARALAAAGRPADIVPARALAEGLLEALDAAGEPLVGRRVIYPCAERTQGALEAGLIARGARLLRAPLYRNVAPAGAGEALDAALPAAVIALASGSAARHLAALGRDLGGARIAAIGPSTARACRALGLEVSAVAEPHTAAGLAAAIRGLIRQ